MSEYKSELDKLKRQNSESTGFHIPMRQNVPEYNQSQAEKSNQKDSKSAGWFQKGAMGDSEKSFVERLFTTGLATKADASMHGTSSILGMGEKVLDTLFMLPANMNRYSPFQSDRDKAEPIREYFANLIESDLYDEEAIARKLIGNKLEEAGIDVDTDSILGEKSAALAGSVGEMGVTAALSYLGVPWWLTTAATSLGGNAESALKEGASMTEANIYAAVATGAEILSEKLFGGSGLGEKGLVNLDKLTKGISNKVVKTLVDFGIDAAAEGFEEFASSFVTRFASALYREENPAEILFSKEAFQEYLDSFISGMAISGMMNTGKAGTSVYNKTDYRNGLTRAEQTEFDALYDQRLKEAEANGKVSQAQKRSIYDATIEEVIAKRKAPTATPTQSEETAQAEKVPTQAEAATQTAQAAQTPSQPMTPQQAMQEAIAETIGVPSVTQAVESFRQNGKVSNSQAEAIIADDGVFREILEMTGIAPPSTKSESRAAVKQAVETIAQQAQTTTQPAAPQQDTDSQLPVHSVGAAMPHEIKRSRVVENTYANATDPEMRAAGEAALKEDPDLGNYAVVPERESLFEASQRLQDEADFEREYEYLTNKRGGWTSSDNDTAMKIRERFFKNGDPRYAEFIQRQSEEGSQAGQFIQSFAKYSRMTPEQTAADAVLFVNKLKESDVVRSAYKDHEGGFEGWKKDMVTSVMDIAKQIGSVESDNVDGMKDIIRTLAKHRKTTAWFGMSSNLTRAAEAAMKNIDFDTAKAIANAQLATMPNDFKKRPVGQVVKTIRIHNMLSALTTINRNLVGNGAVGFIDAVSDSTVGRFADALMSRVTGMRSVGNDIAYGKEYMKGAWDATKMASLCVELDIPMDSESRYTTGSTRTYSPQAGPVMRFMSAYEKYMKYALEVTDQFFEGGTNAAVEKSLDNLGTTANLSEADKKAVADFAGKRRTLKEERAGTRMATQIRSGLNELGTENMGLGDLTMPFAKIGATSAHTAIDYTAGSVTGLVQMFKLMSDVKNGRYENGVKTIYKNGKPVRKVTLAEAQRSAVANFGRGVSGIAVVSAFAGLASAGILKVNDDEDKDKRGLEQSQNLSGAQLNVDAALRALQGKGTDWQDDDLVISIDFLEPFNAQMYLGYLLAQEDSVADAVSSFPANAVRSVISSIADMPAMQGMQEALDILSNMSSIGTDEGDITFGQWAEDSAGQVIGTTASGFIPSWMRQAAQVIDPYYRDTSGNSSMEKALNQVKAAIPGLSQTLPKKYSGLGKEQLRNDDWLSGIFNTMVNPGDADRIKADEVTNFIDELYDLTGDLNIYPDAAAPKSFTQDKKTYTISTKEETEAYQKAYGDEVNKLYGDLIRYADFQALSAEDQAKVLRNAKSAALAVAKSKISGKYDPPSAIKNKPPYKTDAQAILDAYIEAKKKADKQAAKEKAREEYWANKGK